MLKINIRESYTEYNSKTWDKWSAEGGIWTLPIFHTPFFLFHPTLLNLTTVCQIYFLFLQFFLLYGFIKSIILKLC